MYYRGQMDEQGSSVETVVRRAVSHGPDTLDWHVWREIETQMSFVSFERTQAGEARPRFTIVELAEATGLTEDQLGRRKRGVSGFTLDDVYHIAEALGVEPHALIRAAVMRLRAEMKTPPKRLRDQVLEGPAGLPTIQ